MTKNCKKVIFNKMKLVRILLGKQLIISANFSKIISRNKYGVPNDVLHSRSATPKPQQNELYNFVENCRYPSELKGVVEEN
ncbi:hypothetical protein NQ318_004794 [Aromia moschata]|uniref:Uncharacterized protein n=1 Tax=Aromia moschata TaxID=1265417 RepID=A0AAV8XNF2_9CUCU|nr:hypothetical protein NQ318_004794 [Aromia moschata]